MSNIQEINISNKDSRTINMNDDTMEDINVRRVINYDTRIDITFDIDLWNDYQNHEKTSAEMIIIQLIREYYE